MKEDEEEVLRSQPRLSSVDVRTGDATVLQITVTGVVAVMDRDTILAAAYSQLQDVLREMGVPA